MLGGLVATLLVGLTGDLLQALGLAQRAFRRRLRKLAREEEVPEVALGDVYDVTTATRRSRRL